MGREDSLHLAVRLGLIGLASLIGGLGKLDSRGWPWLVSIGFKGAAGLDRLAAP